MTAFGPALESRYISRKLLAAIGNGRQHLRLVQPNTENAKITTAIVGMAVV